MQANRRYFSNKATAFFITAAKNQQAQKGGKAQQLPPPPNGVEIPTYIWVTAIGTASLFGLTYYSFLDQAPLTNRKRWIAVSPEWMSQLGHQEYKQLLHSYRNDILPTDHRASRTLQRVGTRIAEASNQFAKEHTKKKQHPNNNMHESPYTFTVIRSDMANAFVLPGNHVFLFTGLFRYVHDEDELATILGHECAHNVANHVAEKISGSFIINVLARLSLLMDPSGVLFTLILPAAALLRELPNSRIQEIEADRIGLQIAAEACYDPRAAKRVFSALRDNENTEGGGGGGSESSSPPEFLSTHPSHETRLQRFDVWIPHAMERFQADDGKRCHRVRQQMRMLRQAAAQEATYREQRQR